MSRRPFRQKVPMQSGPAQHEPAPSASPDSNAAPDPTASDVYQEPQAYAAPVAGEPLVVPDQVVVAEGDWIAPDDQPTPAPPASEARANAVLVLLAFAAFMSVTNEVAIIGLLKPMAASLGRPEAQIGIGATVFAAAVMVLTLPLAILTTRMVRKWVVVGALALFIVGALVGATADTFAQLLVSRGITGSAHALFWASVTPAAAGMFPLARRGKSVARLLLGPSAAGVVGLPGVTYIGQHYDWHLPFWVLTVGAAVVAVAISAIMPPFRTEQSTVVRGDFPSLARYWRVMAVTVLSTAALSLTWTYYTPLATERFGYTQQQVVWLMILGGAVGVGTTWLVARFLDRWPVKSVAVAELGMALVFAGLTVLGDAPWVLIAMHCLQGVAWSILVAALVNWALRHSPWSSDIGNGLYNSVFNAGNVAGSWLGAIVVASWGVDRLAPVSLVAGAAAFVIAVTVPRERPAGLRKRLARAA